MPITALSTLWILCILTNFNSLSSSRWVLLLSTLSTLHRWINWGIKYLNNLPKITSPYVRSHLALSTTNSMRWVLSSSFCRWDTETEKTKLCARTHHQEGEQLCLAPKTFQNLSVPPLPQRVRKSAWSLLENPGGWREDFIYTLLSELIIQWVNLHLHLSLDSVLHFSKINSKLEFHQPGQIPHMLHCLRGSGASYSLSPGGKAVTETGALLGNRLIEWWLD